METSSRNRKHDASKSISAARRVANAIKKLQEKEGISLPDLKKYLRDERKMDNSEMNFALKHGVDRGILVKESGNYKVEKKRKKVLAEEFIPLNKTKKAKLTKEKKDDVLIIENAVRSLRPIVIDGCNVAMEHGKTSNTFSAKGIKLAVDYFLNRGHTQVTAFVPRFRRFCNRKHCPTTDPELLDDLAKKQQVVFTPSRRVNGKCIVSYDDRFIVQLASANGGVILSNDNYRDLITENDAFKEVIENRLLLFCFVGDMLMIPSDPMGRAGPSLDEYLSFPPDTDKT